MNGLEGLRDLAQEYRTKTGKNIEHIRISTKVARDHCYAGRFNGGPHEIVVGVDAWHRLAGPSATVIHSTYGIKVVDER